MKLLNTQYHTELSKNYNNHVDFNFNYNVLANMTLSYTQVEEFNQKKLYCHVTIYVTV